MQRNQQKKLGLIDNLCRLSDCSVDYEILAFLRDMEDTIPANVRIGTTPRRTASHESVVLR